MYKMPLLITLLSFCLTSCCSVVGNATREVRVTAQQCGAEVFIDGYACGTAPLSVELNKTYNHTIIVAKPGYLPQQALLESRRTWRSASNILMPFGGAVVGTGVGAGLGAACWGVDAFTLGVTAAAGCGIGVAVGLCIGIIGTATDIQSRADCDLCTKSVHFNLMQENDFK